jgi:hypothetical protein
MIYRKLSPEGDYTFGQNKQNYISGREAVAQAVYTRLLLLYGEWWENTEDGLPLFQQIFGNRSKETADLLIRSRILGTTDVTGIASYASTLNVTTRKYQFNCIISTLYGEIELTNPQALEVLF